MAFEIYIVIVKLVKINNIEMEDVKTWGKYMQYVTLLCWLSVGGFSVIYLYESSYDFCVFLFSFLRLFLCSASKFLS